MATTVRIKRKTAGTGAPGSLAYGELAADTVGSVWVGNSGGTPVAVGGGGGTLQDAYDGGNEIVTTAGNPVQILASGSTEYFDPGFLGTVVEGGRLNVLGLAGAVGLSPINSDIPWYAVTVTATDIAFVDVPSPDTITSTTTNFITGGFIVGAVIVVTGSMSNNGTYTIATVAANTITLTVAAALTNEAAGASVTIRSTNTVDFGAGFNLLTQNHQIPGVNSINQPTALVFLKTSTVSGDRGIYAIVTVGNGLGTNSVAGLSNLAGPTSITGTTGILTSGNQTETSANDVNTILLLSGNQVGSGTENFFQLLNDGGNLANIVVIQNTAVGASSNTALSEALLKVFNTDTTGNSDVPLISLQNGGDAPHIHYVGKTSDPTTPSDGDFWYNTTTNVFKYYDGAAVQTLSIGGGGASLFDAIVPTDYATIGAAVTAGETHIRVISNVTETSNIALTSGESYLFWIDEGVTVTYNSTIRFTYTGNTQVILRGGGTLNWTLTTSGQALFDNSSFAGSLFDSDGVKFLNNSSAASTPLTWCNQKIRNFVMTPGTGGIRAFATAAGVEEFYLESGEIAGTSLATNQVISLGAPSIQCYINNVRFTGTFAAPASYLFDITGPVTMRDIIYEGTQAQCRIQGYVTIDGFTNRGTADFTVDVRSDNNTLSRFKETSTGNIIVTTASAGDYHIFDKLTINTLTTGSASNNNKISNCRIETAVTLNGNRNSITNSEFLLGMTVADDNNRFSNCQFGPDIGVGSSTITINATADATTIVGCYTDAVIADAGTNTQPIANTVY